MAYTAADLAAVRVALLRGEQTVQFADRSVTYRSITELLLVESRILTELATPATTRKKQTLGVSSNGF